MPISKWLGLAFCVFSSATWAQDLKPGKVTQTPGTIAWPWPGAGMIVVPNNLLVTNVLTFTLTAQVTPASINRFGIQWQTNGPQPGTVVFTPDNQASTVVTLGSAGTYNLSATVSDGAKVVLNQFTVVANAIQNQAPTITTPSNVAINENTSSGSILFTVGDAETAPGALSVNAVSSNPTLISGAGLALGGAGANRTIDLTPSNNQHGTATITLTVSDGGTPTMSASSSFLLTVSAVNIPPTFTSVPNPVLMNEDVPGSFTVGVDDLDTPLSLLTLTATSTATFISSLVTSGSGASRSVAVGLVSNAFGSGTITLGLTDGQNPITTTTTITVASVNDPPTISPIGPLQTLIGNAISADFTVNDVEDGGNLVVSAATDNPAVLPLANISLTGTGTNRTITVTPIAQGVANVTVTATDTLGAPATRILVVTSSQTPNTAPSITGPGNQVIAEGGVLNLSIPIADAETAPSLLVLSGQSSNQDLLPDGNLILTGTGSTRSLAATPVAFSNGVTTITLILQDTGGLTDTNTFTLTVTPVNDCPVSPQISAQSTLEDTPKLVSFSVIDHDGDTLTLTGTSSNPALVSNDAGHITFGGAGESRTVTLTPLLNQTGQTTISVKVDDGTCAITNSFLLTVAPTNDPPTISGIGPQTFAEDTTNIVSFTISDPETPANLLTLSVTSSDATLTPASAFTFVGSGSARGLKILPATNQSGAALIVVSVSDGTNSISSAYSITVTPVNDAPTIQSLGNQTLPQGAASMTVNFSVADVDSALGGLTLSATTSTPSVLPLSGIVFGGAGGSRSVTFTPIAAGFSTVTLSVSDGSLTSTTPPFTVTMPGPINNLPTITGPADQSVFKSQPTAALPVTVSDAETPAASLILTAATSNPALAPLSGISLGGSGSARTVTVTPVVNQVGTATITLTVQDGAGSSSLASFLLTVLATNYPPTISAVTSPQNVAENSSVSIPITIGDQDTSLSSLVMSGVSGDTTLVPNANIVFTGAGASRTATITPAVNRYGTNTISLRVSDSTTTSSTTFSLQVTFVNQLPTITGLSNQGITTNSAVTQNITIGDIETPAANLTLTGSSSDTSIIANSDITFGGTGANRTVTVRSRNNAGGCTITIIVADGNTPIAGTRSQSFAVTVTGGIVPLTGYFVGAPQSTPPGNDSNSGTDQLHPWTFSKALQAGMVPSGKTVWMLAGTYEGSYRGAPNGITIRPMPGAEWWMPNHVVLDRNLGSCTLGFSDNNAAIMMGSWNHTVLRDVEIRNSFVRCVIADGQSTSRPELIRNLNGTPHGNMIYHCFLRDGMNNLEWEIHQPGEGDTFRGNVSMFGGQGSHYEGGGMGGMWYLQNVMGGTPMRIEDNILGNGYNRIGELNGSSDGPQDNIIFDGNIAFGGGVMGCYRLGCSMGSGYLVCTANSNTDIWFRNNCMYNWMQNYPPIVNGNPVPYDPPISGGGASFGKPNFSSLTHANQVVSNNYICGSFALTVVNPVTSRFLNNTWIAGKYSAGDAYNVTAAGNTFDGNIYYYPNDGFPVIRGTKTWTDAHEQVVIGHPTVNKIIKKVLVDPDGSGKKVMHLACFNWQRLSSLSIDLSQDDYGTAFAADGKNLTIICALNPLATYASLTKMGVSTIPWNTSFVILQPASTFYTGQCISADPGGPASGTQAGGGQPMTTFPDFAAFEVIISN